MSRLLRQPATVRRLLLATSQQLSSSSSSATPAAAAVLPQQTTRPRPASSSPQSLQPYRPSSTFAPGPSPPRLPPDQQAEFERLQREAASVGDAILGPPTDAAAAAAAQYQQQQQTAAGAAAAPLPEAQDLAAAGGGIRRGAPPEFEGDVNPKTGEVGGPKNEPLRWGAQGDYSFNGRVTDF